MNKKISELTQAEALTGAELLPLVQNEQTVKTTASDIVSLAPVPNADKINALTAASTPLSGTETLIIAQGGTTKKTTAQDIANLAPGGGGGGFQLSEAIVPVSADRIKTLFSNPLQLIAAPGAGKYLDIYNVIFEYTFGGIDYQNLSNLRVYYEDYQNNYFSAGVINSATNSYYKSAFFNQPIRVNKGLFVYVAGIDPTNGNGTAVIRVIYRTVTL